MFKSNHWRKEREARRDAYDKSHRWSAVWRKHRRSRSFATCDGSARSRKLLPSLFSCFKKKGNPTQRSSRLERGHNRGGRLLRLMSSFMKKKDETACTQWNHNEDDARPNNTHDSYVLTLGGIHILVEASYQTDHTPVDNADNTAADCHSVSTEPNPDVASQNTEDVVSVATAPVSCASEELDVSTDFIPLDWESNLEPLVLLEKPSLHEVAVVVPQIHQSQPEIRQLTNRQSIGHQLIYRMETDDEAIFQVQQSIAKIERISHLFCYPDHKRSSAYIKQDNNVNQVTGLVTCTWQWMTAISIVFVLLLLM